MATPSAFYVKPVLAGVAAAYARDTAVFAAPVLLPFVPAAKQEGYIFNNDPERVMHRVINSKRGPGGFYAMTDFQSPTQATYNCEDHALSGFVPDEYLKQCDPEAEPSLPTVESITHQLLLEMEVSLVTALGTLSQTSSPSTKWDASAGSLIADVKAQKETIRVQTGRDPNILVCTAQVLDKITETPDFKDRVKFTLTVEQQRAMGPEGVLAATLGVDRVFKAQAYRNTALQGQAASMSSIWGENVLLAYVDNPRSTNVNGSQALGLTVTWDSPAGDVRGGFSVATERINARKGEAMYLNMYYDQITLNTGAGYWFTNVLT